MPFKDPDMPLWDWRPVHQPGFTELPIGCTPPVKTAAADAEISAGFGDLTGLFGVSQNTKLARNLAFFLVHQYLLRPTNVSLLEMSRECRHIYTRRQSTATLLINIPDKDSHIAALKDLDATMVI